MVEDRQISASFVAASGLWVVALTLWGFSYLVGNASLGQLSIIVTAAGVTATVRCFFIDQANRIRTAAMAAQQRTDRRAVRLER